MQEIVRAIQRGELLMDVGCIISSQPKVGGLDKAKALGIPEKDIIVINSDTYRGSDGKIQERPFGKEILEELKKRKITVVTQNGWMPLTPKGVIYEYFEKIFNQHPGPVPEFGGKGMYGKRVHATRLNFLEQVQRDFWTEAIAQRVGLEYDKGEVVKSERVDIFPGDTPETLAARVLPEEHKVQVEMLKDVVIGAIKPVSPRELLVRPGEEQILFVAKQKAFAAYPNG